MIFLLCTLTYLNTNNHFPEMILHSPYYLRWATIPDYTNVIILLRGY